MSIMKPFATCPVCGEDATFEPNTENGGTLFVGEQMDNSVEFFDEANKYECPNSHTFYLSENCTQEPPPESAE